MARKPRKPKSFAAKRAIDADGIVHGFRDRPQKRGLREASTYCGKHLWEEGMGPIGAWKIVPTRPITCVACLGAGLTR